MFVQSLIALVEICEDGQKGQNSRIFEYYRSDLAFLAPAKTLFSSHRQPIGAPPSSLLLYSLPVLLRFPLKLRYPFMYLQPDAPPIAPQRI